MLTKSFSCLMFSQQIAGRLEELAPWEAEKEVERQQRLAHMRRYYSVRKLQRWWRAYMVSYFKFLIMKKIYTCNLNQ